MPATVLATLIHWVAVRRFPRTEGNNPLWTIDPDESSPNASAVLGNVSRRYDRRVIQGVTAYVRENGGWSLYVEEDPLQKLPKLVEWDGDGIIADFDDHKIAVAVREVTIPVVGFGGGYGWHDRDCGIPYLTTDNAAVARLGRPEHLLDCGFTRLAFYGNPRRRLQQWSEERQRGFSATGRCGPRRVRGLPWTSRRCANAGSGNFASWPPG